MIRAMDSVTANDVSVRCQLRKSPQASSPEFEEVRDVVCTMRNWKPTAAKRRSSFSNKVDNCPELLIRPLPSSSENPRGSTPPHQRFPPLQKPHSSSSTSSSSSSEGEKEDLTPFSIPTDDIVVVDTHGRKSYSDPIYITTFSNGYLEFTFASSNSHDVLMTFLKASLPEERIVVTEKTVWIGKEDGGDCSFDVETLTASRMEERIRTEPWSEKMRRRVLRIAGRLEELSGTVADCACSCGSNARQVPTTQRSMEFERRQSPPRDILEHEVHPAMSMETSELSMRVLR